MTALAILIAITALSMAFALGVVTGLWLNAPEGWEDEDGFHTGSKDMAQ